jgi:hypothetical protein
MDSDSSDNSDIMFSQPDIKRKKVFHNSNEDNIYIHEQVSSQISTDTSMFSSIGVFASINEDGNSNIASSHIDNGHIDNGNLDNGMFHIATGPLPEDKKESRRLKKRLDAVRYNDDIARKRKQLCALADIYLTSGVETKSCVYCNCFIKDCNTKFVIVTVTPLLVQQPRKLTKRKVTHDTISSFWARNHELIYKKLYVEFLNDKCAVACIECKALRESAIRVSGVIE